MKFTLFRFVRVKGLEPPRLSSLDPKSSAATNYATRANPNAKIRIIFKTANLLGYILLKIKKKAYLIVIVKEIGLIELYFR